MFIFAALLLFSSPLEEAVIAIRQLPECQSLLSEVEGEGGFSIVETPSAPFEAQWNPNTRAIEINTKTRGHLKVGEIIVSLLFELHNALSDSRLRYLQDLARDRMISKQSFVRKMEQREWKNWELTCILFHKGCEKGLFPKEASARSFNTFENYFRIQQEGGHVEYHAYFYDRLQERQN